MQDRLLNAYLAGTVEDTVFSAKSNEYKAEAARTGEALAPRAERFMEALSSCDLT